MLIKRHIITFIIIGLAINNDIIGQENVGIINVEYFIDEFSQDKDTAQNKYWNIERIKLKGIIFEKNYNPNTIYTFGDYSLIFKSSNKENLYVNCYIDEQSYFSVVNGEEITIEGTLVGTVFTGRLLIIRLRNCFIIK